MSVKLVALTELDNIDSYLVNFELIMTAHKVDKGHWPHYLAPQLTGKAQLAFAALPVSDSVDYDTIKAAILVRSTLTRTRSRIVSGDQNERIAKQN